MKNKTKTIIGCTAALLVVAAGVGALGIASKGFSDWNTENWGNNFEDLIDKENPDEVPTDEKMESLAVDKTDANKTYLMPSKSVNFGNSRMDDDVEKEEVIDTLAYEDNGSFKRNNMVSARGMNNVKPLATGSSITYPQTINLTATVTPSESVETLDLINWTINWEVSESISDYIVLEKANEITCTLKVLKPFSSVATLTVEVGKNGLKASDTCKVNFYKQLTGVDLQLTGSVTDKELSEGEMITYEIQEDYSIGTIDQEDQTEAVVTYSSLLSDYTINYDFTKNDNSGENEGQGTAFSYNVFYGATGNFTNVDVMTGAGRNAMNSKLKTSDGDFKISVNKGVYSDSEIMNITPETVVYPESVQIGDGSDIEIGKN